MPEARIEYQVAMAVESPMGAGAYRADLFDLRGDLIAVVAAGHDEPGPAAAAAERVVDLVRRQLQRWDRAPRASALAELMRLIDEDLQSGAATGTCDALVVACAAGRLVGAGVGGVRAWCLAEPREELTAAQVANSRLGTGMAAPLAFNRAMSDAPIIIAAGAALTALPDAELRDATPGAMLAAVFEAGRRTHADAAMAAVAVRPVDAVQSRYSTRLGAPTSDDSAPGPRRILFAERHAAFAHSVIRSFLRDDEVVVCTSMSEALDAADQTVFDAALVDGELTDGSGEQLVLRLRRLGFPGLIVAVSARDAANERLRAAGADAICSKLEFRRIGAVLADAPRQS